MSAPPTIGLALLATNVRRMVIALHGRQMRANNVEVDDVVQDVMVRILENQRSERSRWNPSRGLSPASYAYTVARTAGANSLRKHRQWGREQAVGDVPEQGAANAGTESSALDAIFALLDLDEEKHMAALLASGCSVAESGRQMGLTESQASELGTRVRALLLPLREG